MYGQVSGAKGLWKKDCDRPYRNYVNEDRQSPSVKSYLKHGHDPKHDTNCHLWTIPNAWSDPAFALNLRNLAATSTDSMPISDNNYRILKPSFRKSCRLPSVRTLLHSEWFWLSAFDLLINVLTLIVTGDQFKPWGTARNGVMACLTGPRHQDAEDRNMQHRISVDLLACSVHLYWRVLLLKWYKH